MGNTLKAQPENFPGKPPCGVPPCGKPNSGIYIEPLMFITVLVVFIFLVNKVHKH